MDGVILSLFFQHIRWEETLVSLHGRGRYAGRVPESRPAPPLWALCGSSVAPSTRSLFSSGRPRPPGDRATPRRPQPSGICRSTRHGPVLGTFLPDPTAVPAHVVSQAAHQLDIQDPSCLARYDRPQTHWGHAAEIKQAYGYRDFHDPNEMFRLLRWLYTRAWLSSERPSVLFATPPLVSSSARCCFPA